MDMPRHSYAERITRVAEELAQRIADEKRRGLPEYERVLLRAEVDEIIGELKGSRSRWLARAHYWRDRFQEATGRTVPRGWELPATVLDETAPADGAPSSHGSIQESD